LTTEAPIVTPFPRLSSEQMDRLVAFTERDDLEVKGLDRSDKRPYRAGCWPYLGLVAAGAFGFAGQGLGLPGPVAVGFALTAAILSSLALIRAFFALRRSRELLGRDEGWHALAWTRDELCFRSLEHCLLIPWDQLADLRCFDEDEGRFLGDTLWLHLDDKQRVLVAPRNGEGLFAGRKMKDWYEDLRGTWHEATGRYPSAGASL
jgi:hypothetical protein